MYITRPSRPTGPLAWSFPVLMPTSHPSVPESVTEPGGTVPEDIAGVDQRHEPRGALPVVGDCVRMPRAIRVDMVYGLLKAADDPDGEPVIQYSVCQSFSDAGLTSIMDSHCSRTIDMLSAAAFFSSGGKFWRYPVDQQRLHRIADRHILRFGVDGDAVPSRVGGNR